MSDCSCPAHLVMSPQAVCSLQFAPNLIHLVKKKTTFGRMKTCDVVLDSVIRPQLISRQHAIIQRMDLNKWRILDGDGKQNSVNGVLVDGVRIKEACELKCGAVITLGEVKLPQWPSPPPEFQYIFESNQSEGQNSSQSKISSKKRAAEIDVGGRLNSNIFDLSSSETAVVDLSRSETAVVDLSRSETAVVDLSTSETVIEIAAKMLKVMTPLISKIEEKNNEKCTQLTTDTSSNELVSPPDLSSDLMCPICTEWIVKCNTLQCGHNFCEDCVDKCLISRLHCPVCRESVTREPIRNKALDSIITRSIKNDDEILDYEKRTKNHNKFMEKNINEIKMLKKRAERSRFEEFLNILDEWSSQDKKKFSEGVEKYSGEARVVYCSLVGLMG
eukprot:GHVL01010842.1.p2 GENE.GHVL01010842.1~~GHVL01010842.1.p2  ORF type:complete len:388 (+),score=91.04 GHVL01010842.1:54-1217(+)